MAAQLPDRIMLNGEYLSLYSNPLEQYWNSGRNRPTFQSTRECRRGYVADWEIRADQLFITGIEGTYKRSFLFFKKISRFTLDTLFPRKPGKLIKAKWFTGKLRVPVGKMMRYGPVEYESRFEKETILTIEHGDVIKTVTLDFVQRTLNVDSVQEPISSTE